jgi:PhoD-like phosphatase
MAELVLGPCLRYVDRTQAVIWVETDASCDVEVRAEPYGAGRAVVERCRTFHVEGHHYGLVTLKGLKPATVHPYEVSLDGLKVWPGLGFPPSTIRTLDPRRPVQIVFGSCRVVGPHQQPATAELDDRRDLDMDALHAYGQRMRDDSFEDLPTALLLLGDQVYADDVPPETQEWIQSRRAAGKGRGAPKTQVADFEEYTRLYRDAWSEPLVRWVLSTIPTAMIFDDHDVHDDWNTSTRWLRRMRAKPWWAERITGALMSYWIYQHLGNMDPDELAADELLAKVRGAQDAGPILRAFAHQADRDPRTARWSYRRDFGATRLVVIDSRCARMLDDDVRQMLDDDEFAWIEDSVAGSFEHLLLATSVPYLLPSALHNIEAWNEAVCGGAWGTAASWLGEVVRQAVDLEHWAAFRESFEQLTELIRAVAKGGLGPPPATVITLSGDVHHAYLAKADFRDSVPTSIWQAVCSPMRNPLPRPVRLLYRSALARPVEVVARLLARSAGVPPPSIDWRLTAGPWFFNQIATLELEGRQARMRLERAVAREGTARLEPLMEQTFGADAEKLVKR